MQYIIAYLFSISYLCHINHIQAQDMKYFRFYIQKEGADSSGAAYPIKESGKDFNVYEKECKFYGGGETKDIPKRDWYDQNGDDEFTPTTPVYKSQDVDVKFAYKGALFSANAYIKNFMEYLATGGTMKIYDEYNRIGRQSVRFVGIPDDAGIVTGKQIGRAHV